MVTLRFRKAARVDRTSPIPSTSIVIARVASPVRLRWGDHKSSRLVLPCLRELPCISTDSIRVTYMSGQDSTVLTPAPDRGTAISSLADACGALVRYSRTWLAAVHPHELTINAANPAVCQSFDVTPEAESTGSPTPLTAVLPYPLGNLVPHLSAEQLRQW